MLHHYRTFSLLALASAMLTGCQNANEPPPPPQQLVGGPCKYEETPGVALVSDADADQVRFLIDGRVVPYARQDLAKEYEYAPGARFSVVEKRITEGTCTPYILEVVGPASGPRQPQSRTNTYTPPDPSLR